MFRDKEIFIIKFPVEIRKSLLNPLPNIEEFCKKKIELNLSVTCKNDGIGNLRELA